ncbi:MAG: FkbM family methyltransferase [Chitinophagaceae bacterium]
MKTFLKSFLKKCLNNYVNLSYTLRHLTKWKKINSIDLSIDDNLISKKIFGNIARGDYEIDENKILQKTFTSDDVLLELGTGIGFNAIYCAKINNNKVLTFEGNPNMIPLIRKNMEKNNVEFALRNEIVISKNFHNSSFSFNVVEDFWSSSLKTVDANIINKVNVPTTNINDIVENFRPTYLVVDIEGGEEDLFDECDWIANSPIKKILLELHADIIGEEKCFMVMNNIIQKGFKMSFDGGPKNVVYFFRSCTWLR